MFPDKHPRSIDNQLKTVPLTNNIATHSQLAPIWKEEDVGLRYDVMSRIPWYEMVNRQLISFAKIEEGHRVIDIGCGTASATRLIAEVVGPNGAVIGIDPSSEMLGQAKANCQDFPQVRFRQGLAENLSTTLADVNFRPDRIVAFNAIHLVSDAWKMILSASIQLHENSIFAFSTAFSNQAVDSREEFQKLKKVFDKITSTARKEYPQEMEGFKKRSTARILNIAQLSHSLEAASLHQIKKELIPIIISSDDLAVFLTVPGVIDQILPTAIPTLVRKALIKHAIMEADVESFNRNWLLMSGTKK